MFSRPQISRLAFLGISWYGLLIFVGIVLAIWLSKKEEKRLDLPKETAIDFALAAIPLGIIGARLYSVVFRIDEYIGDWGRLFNLREGGLAIPGAILGGILAAWITSRRRRISFLSICDMVAPAVVLAQAIGRWGNYINIEAYGLRISNSAWQFFPFAIEVPVGVAPNITWYWHMATFFYESVWNLAVFAALMGLRCKLSKRGDVFFWYVLLYGVGRTVIEGLRGDSLKLINEYVRISQILCALGCVGIAVYYYIRQRQVRRKPGALPHDILLLSSVLLGLATCFIGEFERNAYMGLFTLSQLLTVALLGVNIAILVVRLSRRCPISAVDMLQWAQIAYLILLLIGGIGRVYEDNTFYVTLRQIPSMLQIALATGFFYFAPFPPMGKKRPRPPVEPAPQA